MNIIGIDCATKQRKIGLARASFQDGETLIRDVKVGNENKTALTIVKDWLVDADLTLIALDSPLGWPAELGHNLQSHKAGERIDICPDILFSRYTDREIWRKLDKKPLEVGANLIARTAHSALQLLGQLRTETKLDIPLAWDPDTITETCAIEVYPGATLQAMGIKKEQRLSAISKFTGLNTVEEILSNEHALDALICILAAEDFFTGRCNKPTKRERALAEKEGWIWVQK